MNKLGIVVDNLGPNQLANYLISSANRYLEKSLNCDFLVFQKNVIPFCLPINFAVMNTSEGYDFDGTLVATDLNSALQIATFPGPKRKLFYSWDLEWLRIPRNYEVLRTIYNNPELEIIARSKYHKELIELTWNTKVHSIIEDCNVEDFFNYIKSKQ